MRHFIRSTQRGAFPNPRGPASRARALLRDVARTLSGHYVMADMVRDLRITADAHAGTLHHDIQVLTAALHCGDEKIDDARRLMEGLLRQAATADERLTAIECELRALRDLLGAQREQRSAQRRRYAAHKLSGNGIFIAGFARTGTSILQTALNTCPDIFMLGEANFHQNASKPGFAAWYRAMHQAFGNAPSKSTSCADPDDPDGDGWDVLLHLRQQYRLVGDKMAFRTRALGYDFQKAFRFLQNHFAASHFICTLRHPRDVLGSNAAMFAPRTINDYAVAYLECMAFEIDLLRSFDRATILVHEAIVPESFAALGTWLDCDLSGAYIRCYEARFREARHQVPDWLDNTLFRLAEDFYHRFGRVMEAGPCVPPCVLALDRLRGDLGVALQSIDAGTAALAAE